METYVAIYFLSFIGLRFTATHKAIYMGCNTLCKTCLLPYGGFYSVILKCTSDKLATFAHDIKKM